MSNKQKTKVLFLTKYPNIGASSRYRVYQYLPYLKNIEFKVQSFYSEKSYHLLYKKQHTLKKVCYLLWDILRRIYFILISEFDILYMQRELFPIGLPLVEKILTNRKKSYLRF